MARFGVFAVSFLMAVGAFGQCPDNTCPNATTIDRPIATLYAVQPVFIKFLPLTKENKKLDQICTTFFPSYQDNNTFIVYETRTNLDCSYEVTSYIGANIDTGANSYSNPLLTYVSNIIGSTNCSTFVKYRCNTYGADVNPYVFGQGPLPSGCAGSGSCGFTDSCMQEALQVTSDLLPPSYARQQYYVLPCKCPSNCVTQQMCVAKGNPMYCEEGGACNRKSEKAQKNQTCDEQDIWST